MSEPSPSSEPAVDEPRVLNQGPGRLLLAAYVLMAIAAIARGAFQLAFRFVPGAELAITLSIVSGVIYAVAAFALGRRLRRLALVAVVIELVGVLTVGVLSVTVAGIFGIHSVWSYFGIDYILFPLILPVLGLRWLLRTRS